MVSVYWYTPTAFLIITCTKVCGSFFYHTITRLQPIYNIYNCVCLSVKCNLYTLKHVLKTTVQRENLSSKTLEKLLFYTVKLTILNFNIFYLLFIFFFFFFSFFFSLCRNNTDTCHPSISLTSVQYHSYYCWTCIPANKGCFKIWGHWLIEAVL